MGVPAGPWYIDDTLTFTSNTHRFDTGAGTDGDDVPAYRVYENETSTPILTGSMAKLDDANTIGFYSEQITLSAANGFEVGKSYAIYISGAVNSVTATESHNFKVVASSVTIATGGIASTSFASGAIDAAAIAANAIGASELAQDAAQEIADEVLNRDLAGGGSGNTRNVRNALRSLRNRQAISAGTLTVYAENDSDAAWTAAVTTAAGNPLAEVDPA